jgi:hypothetical protein
MIATHELLCTNAVTVGGFVKREILNMIHHGVLPQLPNSIRYLFSISNLQTFANITQHIRNQTPFRPYIARLKTSERRSSPRDVLISLEQTDAECGAV